MSAHLLKQIEDARVKRSNMRAEQERLEQLSYLENDIRAFQQNAKDIRERAETLGISVDLNEILAMDLPKEDDDWDDSSWMNSGC